MAERGYWGWPPSGSPLVVNGRDDRGWSNFDSSVNAISFGFVATAVLISMFLVLAILEKFLRPTSPPLPPLPAAAVVSHDPLINSGGSHHHHHHLHQYYNRRDDNFQEEVQINFIKPSNSLPSPKVSTNAREVSVLMPGESIPRFIAHPTPTPAPPERFTWPTHHHNHSSEIDIQ